ncbi:DUF6005 family protein [Paenibacillus harenae]|uniref:DUF6005 family protein n=1 Tax=Paenibacillus harenae TaxID=306543 RepID=UPI00048C110A|nr:DUF6005 family protein [Paenibacillus harenae]
MEAAPEEVSIKVHCIVSCFCEVVKRSSAVDYRPFYLGVWDAEFDVTERGAITYYQHSLSHDYFTTWFERLFGPKVHEWYDRTKDRESNVSTLLSLIESRPEHRYIVAQIDMACMPVRENKFHQKPFPHFLMLSATEREDEWFMLDPDFRWEGIVKKDLVIEAFRQNQFGGGFYIDALDIRDPSDEMVELLYDTSFGKHDNELTNRLKELIGNVAGTGQEGYARLVETVKQLPVIAIRKYSYEHALMYFNSRTGDAYEQFDEWTDRIEELVQGYSNVQYRTIKLAMTGNASLLPGILQSLDVLDMLELSIKQELHRKFLQWKQFASTREEAAR